MDAPSVCGACFKIFERSNVFCKFCNSTYCCLDCKISASGRHGQNACVDENGNIKNADFPDIVPASDGRNERIRALTDGGKAPAMITKDQNTGEVRFACSAWRAFEMLQPILLDVTGKSLRIDPTVKATGDTAFCVAEFSDYEDLAEQYLMATRTIAQRAAAFVSSMFAPRGEILKRQTPLFTATIGIPDFIREQLSGTETMFLLEVVHRLGFTAILFRIRNPSKSKEEHDEYSYLLQRVALVANAGEMAHVLEFDSKDILDLTGVGLEGSDRAINPENGMMGVFSPDLSEIPADRAASTRTWLAKLIKKPGVYGVNSNWPYIQVTSKMLIMQLDKLCNKK